MTTNKPSSQANIEISQNDYIRFRDLILERSGLHFPEHKRIDLTTGLAHALSQAPLFSSGRGDLNAYYNLLRDNNSQIGQTEMHRLINILTIGETYFFRDEAQFDALTYQVLPEIVERKRAIATAFSSLGTPQLRIWSAGCASGEEPYSIAMILREVIPDIDKWQIFILGTDINQNNLNKAKKGCYSNWSFRETRAKALRARYFTQLPDDPTYKLNDVIQKMVTFERLNLIEDTYPNVYNNTVSMDLIFCRNVTIYFTQEVTQKVIHRFYDALSPKGWLIVGHAESSLTTYRAFEAKTFPSAILYQKTNQPTVWPDIWDKKKSDTLPQGLPAALLDTSKKYLYYFLSPPPSKGEGRPEPSPFKGEGRVGVQPSPFKGEGRVGVDCYELGKALLEQGKFDQAVKQLKTKIALAPNFAPAYSLLGRAYANMGRWVEAKQWCERAVELDQLLAEPYYMLALVYQNENRIELSIANLKKATYLDHNAPLPYFHLAMLYKKIGEHDQAKRVFQIVVKILQKWSPTQIIPETGGGTVQRLLDISRRMVIEL